MKNQLKPFIILLASFMLISVSVTAKITDQDKKEIKNKIDVISEAVNNNDAETVASLISDNADPGLKSEISGSIDQIMVIEQNISSYEKLDDSRVKVECTFSASGQGWNISGFSNYYIFEKIDGSWLIKDTNFHERTGTGAVFRTMGIYFLFFIPILILIIVSFWKIFVKAGEPGWACIIPIYNIIVLLRIVGKPWGWIFLLLIPFVNFIILIIILHKLSLSFGKGAGFTLGLIFLNIIFIPVLAFSKAQYVGPGGKTNE